jgi:hypothetical protein
MNNSIESQVFLLHETHQPSPFLKPTGKGEITRAPAVHQYHLILIKKKSRTCDKACPHHHDIHTIPSQLSRDGEVKLIQRFWTLAHITRVDSEVATSEARRILRNPDRSRFEFRFQPERTPCPSTPAFLCTNLEPCDNSAINNATIYNGWAAYVVARFYVGGYS